MSTTTRALSAALPFFVMGVVATVDLWAGPGLGYLPLMALGPAFASTSGSIRRVVLIGLLAMGLCEALAFYDGLLDTWRNALALATVAGVTVAGVIAGAGRRQRERELANVRVVAEVAQRVLLRPVPREIGPFQMTARYISATAEAQIGGDLYEVVATPGSIRLIIGDVQGKGLAAVETAAAVLGAFRQFAFDAPDLVTLAGQLELRVSRQIAAEEFVTVALVEFHHELDKVEMVNCGHPPPLLLRGGKAAFVGSEQVGPPIGLADMSGFIRKAQFVAFSPRDWMLLYTDGISEARDPQGGFFPLADRCRVLVRNGFDAALDRLQEEVFEHVGSQIDDDAAMLLVRLRPRGFS